MDNNCKKRENQMHSDSLKNLYTLDWLPNHNAKVAIFLIFKRTNDIDVVIFSHIMKELLKAFCMELLTIDIDYIEIFIKRLIINIENVILLRPFVHEIHV